MGPKNFLIFFLKAINCKRLASNNKTSPRCFIKNINPSKRVFLSLQPASKDLNFSHVSLHAAKTKKNIIYIFLPQRREGMVSLQILADKSQQFGRQKFKAKNEWLSKLTLTCNSNQNMHSCSKMTTLPMNWSKLSKFLFVNKYLLLFWHVCDVLGVFLMHGALI